MYRCWCAVQLTAYYVTRTRLVAEKASGIPRDFSTNGVAQLYLAAMRHGLRFMRACLNGSDNPCNCTLPATGVITTHAPAVQSSPQHELSALLPTKRHVTVLCDAQSLNSGDGAGAAAASRHSRRSRKCARYQTPNRMNATNAATTAHTGAVRAEQQAPLRMAACTQLQLGQAMGGYGRCRMCTVVMCSSSAVHACLCSVLEKPLRISESYTYARAELIISSASCAWQS